MSKSIFEMKRKQFLRPKVLKPCIFNPGFLRSVGNFQVFRIIKGSSNLNFVKQKNKRKRKYRNKDAKLLDFNARQSFKNFPLTLKYLS